MISLFEVISGYRKLKFPAGVPKILVVRAAGMGVCADVVYDGGKCLVDTAEGTHTDMITSWKENVRLVAIPLPDGEPLARFAFEFSTLLNELQPSLDYIKDYCDRMLIYLEDTASVKERNNMQKRDSKGRFMKATNKGCAGSCKRKHDTCKCSKPANSVKDDGPQLPVDCSNLSEDELEQLIRALVTELANAIYIPGKTMTIDVTVEDNSEGDVTDEDAGALDTDADKSYSDNFMDSFRAFLKERGVELG